MKIIFQTSSILIVCVLLALIVSGCSKKGPAYGVTIGNYTNQGIIFYNLPVRQLKEHNEWKKYPGVPGIRDDITRFSHFVSSPSALPDQITVKWQIAKLTNCEHIREGRAKKSQKPDDFDENDSHIYIWRNSCDWRPIPNKIFETTLDLKRYHDHPAIQKMGTKREDGGTYGASIMLSFYGENDIRVTVTQTGSPPFPGFYN